MRINLIINVIYILLIHCQLHIILRNKYFVFDCVWGLSSHSRIFHSYGNVTIAGKGLQILSHTRLSCPLSCLFVCFGFIVPLENFSLIRRRHHCRWVLQILTNARPLSSEGTLACHTYCDTVHSVIMVISEDPDTIAKRLVGSCHYLFLRLRSVAAGIRTPNLPLAGPTL